MLEGLKWYTTGLPSLCLSLHDQAEKDFANARKKAFLRRILAFLRRGGSDSNELLCFERVRINHGAVGQASLGMHSIPVSKIVGSVGRYGDFDRAFLPTKGHLRERWQRIDRMLHQSGTLPPVSLYKIEDSYFVLDGNHRVSVARYHGIERIDAQVIEFYGWDSRETRPPESRKHRDAKQGRGRSMDRRRLAQKARTSVRSDSATAGER